MALATALQTEKAFQKQLGVSGCFKSKEKKNPGKRSVERLPVPRQPWV